MRFWLPLLTGVLSVLTWAQPSLAEVQEFIAPKAIKVYAEANTQSKVVAELERGDKVPISSKNFGGFRRVLVRIDGTKVMGYIKESYVSESSVGGGTDHEKNLAAMYHNHVGFGLYLALASLSQDARTIKDQSGGSSIKVSALSGYTTYLGILLDIPATPQISVRLVGSLRRANLTGTTQISSNITQSVQVNQEMLGAGAFGKYYFWKDAELWAGVGFEVDKATNVTLVYSNNVNVPVDQSTYPTYFFTQAAVGYDYNVWGGFYILPEIRAGAVVNAQPIITDYEFIIGAAYAF